MAEHCAGQHNICKSLKRQKVSEVQRLKSGVQNNRKERCYQDFFFFFLVGLGSLSMKNKTKFPIECIYTLGWNSECVSKSNTLISPA